MADELEQQEQPAAQVPLLKGMSLLGWLALAGLGGFAAVSTMSRVACEFREFREGPERCAELREEWADDMKLTGAGFLMLFAHSPGESGGLLGKLMGGSSSGKRRRDDGGFVGNMARWAVSDVATGVTAGVVSTVADQAVTRLLGAPPVASVMDRFGEGETIAQKPDVKAPDLDVITARLEEQTVEELRGMARDHGLKGLARAGRKDELVTVLAALKGKGR